MESKTLKFNGAILSKNYCYFPTAQNLIFEATVRAFEEKPACRGLFGNNLAQRTT